jgi:hypothetical protein
MQTIKKFEEDDFAERIMINYEGIAPNSALKENLYYIFICIMKCLPIIIIGKAGTSKSLACRIICDKFRDNFINKGKIEDEWVQSFPKISEFYFEGSISCLTKNVERRLRSAK